MTQVPTTHPCILGHACQVAQAWLLVAQAGRGALAGLEVLVEVVDLKGAEGEGRGHRAGQISGQVPQEAE